jgi:hypothetical protein
MNEVVMPAQYHFDITLLDVENLDDGPRPLPSCAGYSEIFPGIRKLKLKGSKRFCVKLVNHFIRKLTWEPEKSLPTL